MKKDQTKYLMQRLSKAEQSQNPRYKRDAKEPAKVRAARKVISAWTAAQNKVYNKEVRLLLERKRKVHEVILFGDTDKALAALKKFESGQ